MAVSAVLPSSLPAPHAADPNVRRLHVVVVDEELPYPMNSGKRLRTLNLLLRLARRHRIAYLCHRNADPDETRCAETFFADHGIETLVVNRSVPRKSGPLFYARLAANLLSPLPYSVATHRSAALREAVAAYAARHDVDLWQCEWTPYVTALGAKPTARRLVMAHNVESQIWQRYHDTEGNPLKRWYIGQQWRKFERFERDAYSAADCTIAVSAEDATTIREGFGGRRVEVVDNGVDTTFFQPTGEERCAGQILFLGALDWRPNLDAVRTLLDVVFPAVRAQEASARLVLVGRNPPGWLHTQVAGMPGVELHGNVADVRPFLARSAVLAVPLRIGGGSRLKILEALACGLPVVSTRVGAEGLCLEAGQHLTITDGTSGFAEVLLDCLRSPESARKQAERGRHQVLECYDWDTLAERLERVWLRCVEKPAQGEE
jgi:glycosyltransferase involved in cell wall biosynthesis